MGALNAAPSQLPRRAGSDAGLSDPASQAISRHHCCGRTDRWGTNPWRDYATTLRHIEALSRSREHKKPFIHMTLSAPLGARFARPQWHKLIEVALQKLGLPPRALL